MYILKKSLYFSRVQIFPFINDKLLVCHTLSKFNADEVMDMKIIPRLQSKGIIELYKYL